jgi:cytochrome c biogenesis protein CcmG, thiol:disulfide interchange protein DsbE
MRAGAILLTLIAVVALAVALAVGSPSVRRAAPPLPRSVLSGSSVTLASLRGRPALVDFFASWCEPCTAEASAVARAARALRGRASVVAVDWSDSRRYAERFIARFRWRFPVLADPNGQVGRDYGVESLPTAIVLDARGRIVERLLGPQSASRLKKAVAIG